MKLVQVMDWQLHKLFRSKEWRSQLDALRSLQANQKRWPADTWWLQTELSEQGARHGYAGERGVQKCRYLLIPREWR
jgi:hypothetical protein